MLNLTRQNFDKLRRRLLRQKKSVEEELKRIKADDPLISDGLAESVEPGVASWMADVHSKAVALKDNLSELLSKTQQSLVNLKKGNYGKCEKCGKDIEIARLQAMPTATLCIACSKKK